MSSKKQKISSRQKGGPKRDPTTGQLGPGDWFPGQEVHVKDVAKVEGIGKKIASYLPYFPGHPKWEYFPITTYYNAQNEWVKHKFLQGSPYRNMETAEIRQQLDSQKAHFESIRPEWRKSYDDYYSWLWEDEKTAPRNIAYKTTEFDDIKEGEETPELREGWNYRNKTFRQAHRDLLSDGPLQIKAPPKLTAADVEEANYLRSRAFAKVRDIRNYERQRDEQLAIEQTMREKYPDFPVDSVVKWDDEELTDAARGAMHEWNSFHRRRRHYEGYEQISHHSQEMGDHPLHPLEFL